MTSFDFISSCFN
uniref:Uncharacterized protein n=1 Tax=Lepeophtheirus salmonis TaxID=72036 RepID=A0A0K2VL15_LEPSM